MRDLVRVRTGGADDLAAVLYIAAGSHGAPRWTKAQYLEALCVGQQTALRRIALVAQQETDVVGFAVVSALCSILPSEADLESIAVAPERREHGVGQALLQEATLWAEQQGASSLRLEVRRGNARALRLYTAAGFVVAGVRSGYYADPVEDAVCMDLALPAPRGLAL